jgi:hypothetical protein
MLVGRMAVPAMAMAAMLVAAGCTGDVGDKAAAAKVQVFETGALRTTHFKYAGPVEAQSCNFQTDAGGTTAKDDAVEQLRYQALQLHGNAVMNLNCTEGGSFCFHAMHCDGEAIDLDMPAAD